MTDRDQHGSVTGPLLLGVLWVGVIVAAIGVVWTLPATGDVRAWRWLGTAVVLFGATIITGVAIDW